MALILITPPADPVITLAEAKAHLRVDTADDDAFIEALVEVATAHVDGRDGWLNRALKPQTWELVFDEFPCGPLMLPLAPLIEVESVKYIDEDGDEQTFADTFYEVDVDSQPGWLVLVSSESWPDIMDTINALRVRFVAGYEDSLTSGSGGAESTVPRPIVHAIKLMVGDLYAHRETVAETAMAEIPIPTTAKALLHPYRVFL